MRPDKSYASKLQHTLKWKVNFIQSLLTTLECDFMGIETISPELLSSFLSLDIPSKCELSRTDVLLDLYQPQKIECE